MRIRIIISFLFLLFVSIKGYAQDDEISFKSIKTKQSYLTDSSHWTIEIPIWIPGYRGDFSYGEIELEGEDGTSPIPEHPIEPPGFGDSFKRFFNTKFGVNFVFLTSVSYNNGPFYGEFDMFSGTIGSDVEFRFNDYSIVSANIHSDLLRFSAGYNLYKHKLFRNRANYKFYAYTGIRLQYIKVSSDLDNIDQDFSVNPLWVQPLLGIRNEIEFDYWKFIVQGDMGGFGFDDKFSYMINFYSFYRISNLLSLKLGWNDLYINANDQIKDEELKLKIHLAGPVAAIIFNF